MGDALSRSPLDYATWFPRVLDAVQDLVYVYHLDPPRYVYISPSVERLTGYTVDECYTDRGIAARHVHPADKARLEASLVNLSGPQRIELRVVHRDGSVRWMEQENTPIRDEVGRVVALYGSARDISDRKTAERERTAVQTRLMKAEKMESVGRLSGAVAHDFNNLLTVIAGYAALLQEDCEDASPTGQKLAEILRATDRARDLTQKLLVFSRKQPSRPRMIGIDAFVRDEAGVVPRLVGEQITVHTTLAAPDVCVYMDPAQLTQILANLVLNARDAMPDGGSLTLATGFETLEPARAAQHPGTRAGAFVRLSIADTGIGMDDTIQAHLFEPFFTTKRMGTGAGLGLATVYGLVQQAGGFVEVETAPARGTTMSLFLPVTAAPCLDDEQGDFAAVRGGTETVLIVEDEDSVRALTHTILSRLGYKVTNATGPAEAIALARDGRRFDIIISDVVMPGMTGWRMIREMEQITPGFKVLYVSGFAEAEADGGSELHADPAHFLAKPFTPAELAKKVRAQLDA
jgi:PAS domain S-box-containing protein